MKTFATENIVQSCRLPGYVLLTACLLLSGCQKPELEQRLAVLIAEAENGNRQAQFNVARRYESGNGLKRDDEKALHWYTLAADAGLASAQFQLAEWHRTGRPGMKTDPEVAAHWYRRAALQGHQDAQLQMSMMYREGIGLRQNHRKSVAWLAAAARRGHPGARLGLAGLYMEGRLPHRNDADAVRLIHRVAQSGKPEYEALVGWMYALGIGVPLDHAEAALWLDRAAAHGRQNVSFLRDRLAIIAATLSEPDPDWIQSYAHPQTRVVRYPLDVLYGAGFELPTDETGLKDWFQAQANAGIVTAWYDLAWCYYLGKGVPADDDTALQWFRRAADRGYPPALAVLEQLGEAERRDEPADGS
ncbi:MAG: hypothetical protein QNK37_14740 [Acidobacteriota bacterium]|nr:hypothetical protein [Acidobacteriota bacterium]